MTLVHSQSRLLPKFDPRMHDHVLARLNELGVDVVLEDRVEMCEPVNGLVITKNGKEIMCDRLVREILLQL